MVRDDNGFNSGFKIEAVSDDDNRCWLALRSESIKVKIAEGGKVKAQRAWNGCTILEVRTQEGVEKWHEVKDCKANVNVFEEWGENNWLGKWWHQQFCVKDGVSLNEQRFLYESERVMTWNKSQKWKLQIHHQPRGMLDTKGKGQWPFLPWIHLHPLLSNSEKDHPPWIYSNWVTILHGLFVFIFVENASFSLSLSKTSWVFMAWLFGTLQYSCCTSILHELQHKKICMCQQKVGTTLGFPTQEWSPWCVINQQERCAFCKETPRGHFPRCDQSPPCWSCYSNYHSVPTASSRGRNKTVSVNV